MKRAWAVGLVLGSLAAGCGPDEGDTADAVVPAPTFDVIYNDVLEDRGCTESVCHGKSVSWTPLSDIDTAHQNLLGDASLPGCGLTQLVVPGDPESSLLYMRVSPDLDPEAACGAKMPQGSSGLDATKAQMIYDWILAGALR
jgi:hypothetical protein